MAGHNTIATVVKLIAGLYLLFVASRVWFRDSSAVAPNSQVVHPYEVGIATLLNPKALIFALVIFPPPPADISIHLALFAILVPLLGMCWIGLGLTVAHALRPGRGHRMVRRFGAAITGVFATILIATTVA
jgi:threonine/homoserine/homoserine lactone efflux protein